MRNTDEGLSNTQPGMVGIVGSPNKPTKWEASIDAF